MISLEPLFTSKFKRNSDEASYWETSNHKFIIVPITAKSGNHKIHLRHLAAFAKGWSEGEPYSWRGAGRGRLWKYFPSIMLGQWSLKQCWPLVPPRVSLKVCFASCHKDLLRSQVVTATSKLQCQEKNYAFRTMPPSLSCVGVVKKGRCTIRRGGIMSPEMSAVRSMVLLPVISTKRYAINIRVFSLGTRDSREDPTNAFNPECILIATTVVA